MAPTSAPPQTDSPLHLLLVEDDQDEQLLFRIAARKTQLKLQVQTVGHGEQAIAYLEGAAPYSDRDLYPQPRLIVLDLKLPVMDGCELLGWLKASPAFQHLPVVAISGSPDQGLRTRAQALGAAHFLEKPFGIENWTLMVRQIWGIAHLTASPLSSQAHATR